MHDPVIHPMKQFDPVTGKYFECKSHRDAAFMRDAASKCFCKLSNMEQVLFISEDRGYFVTFYDFGPELKKQVYEVRMKKLNSSAKQEKTLKSYFTGEQILRYLNGSDSIYRLNLFYAKYPHYCRYCNRPLIKTPDM